MEIRPNLAANITKSAGIIYAYYLEYPERFNHEPYNIVGHIYKACHDAMLGLAKLNNILDNKYYKMDYKLCVKNKDKILEVLHVEGKRVQTFRYFSNIDYKNYEPEGT